MCGVISAYDSRSYSGEAQVFLLLKLLLRNETNKKAINSQKIASLNEVACVLKQDYCSCFAISISKEYVC